MFPRRHSRVGSSSILVLVLSSGCYHGAIYSSYQEGSLGIRTTADSSAPIKVIFGYDQSVAALVPRRGTDATPGEATSIIAKDEVGATIALPAKIPDDVKNTTAASDAKQKASTQVKVDSAFISGTAAIVASVPTDTKVVLFAEGTKPQDAQSKKEASAPLTLVTQGTPGDRIATALTQQASLPAPAGILLNTNREIASKFPAGAARDKVYAAGAAAMPANSDFRKTYDATRSAGISPSDAFAFAQKMYLQGQPDDSPRYQELTDKLTSAQKEN